MKDNRRYGTSQIGEIIGTQLRPAFRKFGMAGAHIMAHWNEIVGHPLSNICMPESLRFNNGSKTDGSLVLRVAPGWTLEIQHQSHVIMERIACFCGYNAVGKIIIKQDHRLIAKPKKESLANDLPEHLQQKLTTMLGATSNEKLRDRLMALGKSVIALEEAKQKL